MSNQNNWIEPKLKPFEAITPAPIPKQRQRKIKLRTGKKCIEDAENQPPIIDLIPGVWNFGQFAIIAGDTGAGKSLYAMHEAFRIAAEHVVLYYDFELSDRQFEKRYKNVNIPENFIIAKFDPESLDFDFSFEDIAADIQETGAKVVIIDNLTALSLRTTADADAAIKVCRGLKELQIKQGTSTLILAHVPKIAPGTPLNVNHLAGSKNLANFADGITFIGKSCDGESIRYVKTVKNRDGETPGVWAFQIVDPGGNLHYNYLGHCEESDHLQPNANEIFKADAIEKRAQGKSYREIEKELYFEHGKKVSYVTIKNWNDATKLNGNEFLQNEHSELPFD